MTMTAITIRSTSTPPALSGEQLTAAIRQEHEAASAAAGAALGHALEAGRLLAEARATIPHGAWESYVRESCSIAPRTASLYLRLHRHRDRLPNRQHVADLSVRQAARLLEGPRARAETEVERPAVDRLSAAAAARAKAESLEAERILDSVSDRYRAAGLPGPAGVLVYFDERWLSECDSQNHEFEASGCRFEVRMPVGVQLLSEKTSRIDFGRAARQGASA
jgi:hypothetical protein